MRSGYRPEGFYNRGARLFVIDMGQLTSFSGYEDIWLFSLGRSLKIYRDSSISR